MDLPLTAYISAALFFSVAAYLLFSGLRHNWWWQFKSFYAFVAWSVIRDLSRWGVLWIWGYTSSTYYHFYYTVGLLNPIMALLVLTEIYFKIKHRSDRSHWIGLLAFMVLIGLTVERSRPDFYTAFCTLALEFMLALCALIQVQLHRSDDILLGNSYRGVVFGMTVITVLFTVIYFGNMAELLPNWFMGNVYQPIAASTWLLFLWAFRQVDLDYSRVSASYNLGQEVPILR